MHTWCHLASALGLRRGKSLCFQNEVTAFEIPSHSHGHMLDALGSRADNLFLFVLWTDWEIEASQFKIPSLLPVKLDHDYSLWPNGLPHAFSPQVLNSVHPIPGRLAGHSCLWVERESLCPEDKRLLKRKRVSHVRIMTSNTLAPFSTAMCSQSMVLTQAALALPQNLLEM